jgi:hypothetical protein
MQKVIVTGECQAKLVEVADPQPKEDWALVKVMPMCDVAKAFDLQTSGQCAKILLKPCEV